MSDFGTAAAGTGHAAWPQFWMRMTVMVKVTADAPSNSETPARRDRLMQPLSEKRDRIAPIKETKKKRL